MLNKALNVLEDYIGEFIQLWHEKEFMVRSHKGQIGKSDLMKVKQKPH